MRVIAGTARSIPLVSPRGAETRPTTDRIKETLFNILQFELQEAVFIDIFSGSGAIGIEALSRGAKKCVFVDNGKAQIEAITANVTKCRFMDKAKIVRTDAAMVSGYMPKDKDDKFIIFMDPPYGTGAAKDVLENLVRGGYIGDDTLIILEEALTVDPDYFEELGLTETRVKRYKNQKHIFIRKK